MITLKLPIQNKIEIPSIIAREYNSCLRYSYNRFKESMSEKDIRHDIKAKELFKNIDSWFIQCAIKEGQSLFKKNEKVVFGGKKNLRKRYLNKITNFQWKELRNYSINIIGEAKEKGNRKFNLDIINSNKIVFKPKQGTKIEIQLPKLRTNIKKQLYKLEGLANQKQIPYTIKLNNQFIWITFDEAILKQKPEVIQENRCLSIDLNPNYIGYSILEFDKNKEFKVINTGIFDITKLNTKLNLANTHKLQLKQTNKRDFELFEISKKLINITKQFKCSQFIVEDLNMKTKNHNKGSAYNRLVNNCWNRNDIVNNLKKRCVINNIKFIEINPAYTSYIGNILYGSKYPDMIASAIEVGRRGYFKYEKEQFYPELISKDNLSNLWKEAIDWNYLTWVELCSQIKTLKLKYRSSLTDFKFKVFSLNNINSGVSIYRDISACSV